MKPGPVPKPNARRQRHATPATLEGVRGPTIVPPEPPPGLPPVVLGWWRDLWASELGPLLRTTDMPALRRLFQAYADRERVREQMRPKGRRPQPRQRKDEGHNDFLHRQAVWRREQAMTEFVVYDDRGGVKINPLMRLADELEARIVALEDRLAMNPASRAKLGLAQMRARTLAEHNAITTGPDEASESDEITPDDPRYVLIEIEDARRTRRRRTKGADE